MFIRNGYFERYVYIGSYYYYYSIFMMDYRYMLFIIKTKKIGTKESFRSHLSVKQQFPKSIQLASPCQCKYNTTQNKF